MAADDDRETAEGLGGPPGRDGYRLDGSAGYEEILESLCRRAVRELALSRCEALARERPAGVVRVLATWDPAADVGAPARPWRRGVRESDTAARAAAEGTVACWNEDQDATAAQRAAPRRQATRALIVAPVFSGTEVIGFLAGVDGGAARVFSASERQAFAALAAEAPVPLSGAQLLGELQRRRQAAQLVAGTVEEFASARELDTLLARVGGYLLAALDVSRCSVFVLDEESGDLVAAAHHRAAGVWPDRETLSHRMDGEHWPRGHRALTRPDPLIEYSDGGPGSQPGSPSREDSAEAGGERATLTVPLRWRGAAVGVIDVAEARGERRFAEDELVLTKTMASLVAAAVAEARLRALVQRRATVDELTGLQNRRTFMMRLDESLAQARRYGSALSLLMVDVDDLTAFNDAYGHVAGDSLLRSLAALLRGAVRTNIDMVARYGGEEFVVLLPQTAGDGAATAAARLRGSLVEEATGVAEALRVATERQRFAGPPAAAGMTISVGVAFYPQHGTTALELLMAVDRALYAAKRGGKNQVRVYEA